MKVLFKKAAIIGLGLIGGSLALAAKKQRLAGSIFGVDRDRQELERARAKSALDRFTVKLRELPSDCDLIILATPVGQFEPLVRKLISRIGPGCVVTDVGSTKAAPVALLESLMPKGAAFVGAHPIAGKEKSGFQAATPDLFSKAKCILTPTSQTDRNALRKVKQFWTRIGAQVILMDPEEHDRVLATISHLPHLVAYAMVNTALNVLDEDKKLLSLSGGGFRDFTRIAASSPEMWRDICLQNDKHILCNIEAYEAVMARLKDMIRSRDRDGLMREMQRARGIREKLA